MNDMLLILNWIDDSVGSIMLRKAIRSSAISSISENSDGTATVQVDGRFHRVTQPYAAIIAAMKEPAIIILDDRSRRTIQNALQKMVQDANFQDDPSHIGSLIQMLDTDPCQIIDNQPAASQAADQAAG